MYVSYGNSLSDICISLVAAHSHIVAGLQRTYHGLEKTVFSIPMMQVVSSQPTLLYAAD